MSRNQPNARLICMNPSKRFLRNILRCNKLSRNTSLTALIRERLKNPVITFDLSFLSRLVNHAVYFTARYPSRKIRPRVKGRTNGSNFMFCNFINRELYQVYYISCVHAPWTGIYAFAAKTAAVHRIQDLL